MNGSPAGFRFAEDSLGKIPVPVGRYYGAQTARSLKNFNICSKSDKMPLQIIYSLAMIKEVAASINFKLGRINKEISQAIIQACHEVYQGQHDEEFPLVIWQTGSDTNGATKTRCVDMYKESPPVVDLIFKPAKNKFAALAGHDALLQLSGSFNTIATALMRLANDFCLLSSGPSCGLNEFILPANEPGSSIMPGKVNPTQCESLRMVCLQIMGNHFTISMAASQGQLELNVYKPLIIANLLHSCELLSDSTRCFTDNCVKGLKLNLDQIQEYVNKSLMLVTVLTPHIGYDLSAELVKYAIKFKKGLRESVIELNLLNEEKFDEIVKPYEMAFPYSKI
ncbi:unnamed protein product [Heterobilharzia americana]|nr:unnamed protein product [Heterobilharzia americana]